MGENHSHTHNHGHDHSHGHHHVHTIEPGQLNKAFVIGIVLNFGFVIVEVIAGLYSNSLALLTDAGHNLADAGGLALALIAFKLTTVKADKNFTYGYNKTTVLVSLINAFILLIGVGVIGYEAVQRILKPEPEQGGIMAIVALVGIVINGASALLFISNKEKDLNAKGAYLHMASDAIVSLGVVIAGVVIYYTHWFWVDSAISISIMLVILYSTWGLLADSLRLTLDAVPRDIDIDKVKAELLKLKGITDIHHIHVWALSTQINALTAHVVVNESVNAEAEQKLKENIKHRLLHHNIKHATLETERVDIPCKDDECLEGEK